jgi:DNA modification methylase
MVSTDIFGTGTKSVNPALKNESVSEPSIYQIPLIEPWALTMPDLPYREKLVHLLSSSLDFHDAVTNYATHNYHSFPAKFPPQLPERFILGLTELNDVILDPMMGSGTTIVEAILHGRRAIGFDLDPLAILITNVKTRPLNAKHVSEMGRQVITASAERVQHHREDLLVSLTTRWDPKTRDFVDYWFAQETQIELAALIDAIGVVADEGVRAFLELVFSACIITKSGGVSLAFDLAHTRPHRAKVVYSQSGEIILGKELADSNAPRIKLLTKNLRSAISEFQRRLHQNMVGLQELRPDLNLPDLRDGTAEDMPLPSASVDLIVTSPPYASNAIDYMRAHKFSLVWLGYSVGDLGLTRGKYIGGESVSEFGFEVLPPYTTRIIDTIGAIDGKRGEVLRRYYSEMKRVLREMYRVLKPGKASIVVVASSIMRGIDTETDHCLAEIGQSVGLEVPHIGVRQLDRDKRMMPAGISIDRESQIQQRMHEEYVIGFRKPES